MSDNQPSNLAVLMFQGQDTAQTLYEKIEQMEKDKLVEVDDAIILECVDSGGYLHAAPGETTSARLNAPPTTGKGPSITVKQTHGKKGKYAAIGGGIGLLAGAIFGGPIGLIAMGSAGVGAIVAALKDFGIDDKSIDAVKQRMQPDTSALIVLGRANDRDAFIAALQEYDAQLVSSSLDPEVERELVARLDTK